MSTPIRPFYEKALLNRMRKHMKQLLAALTLVVAISAAAQPFTVVGVADGDTVTVLNAEKQQLRCRLFGIDAAEKKQAFGQVSKQSLSDLVYRQIVDVQVVDRDRYGRSICRITVDGIDVNRQQVERGMAWVYRRYTKDPLYIQAESAARAQRLGLWHDAGPIPPWDFRKYGDPTSMEYRFNQ